MSAPYGSVPTGFPTDFVWGTATSSYQIEGAATAGRRGPSIWDTFSRIPGAIKDESDGRVACDHWNRWPDDVALMKELGIGAYRLSIAWPRVYPTGLETRPIQDGLDVYDRMVDGLLEAGISPWVTLYHWDLPQGLEDRGGWINRDTVDRFVAFSAAVAARLGDRVENWITHNEPWCAAHLGYGTGLHAPGGTDLAASLIAAHHILLSHGKAVPVLRAMLPEHATIGITLNFSPGFAASASEADARATHLHDGFFNRWYLDPLLGKGYPEDMLAHYADRGLMHRPPTWLKDGDLDAIATPMDFLGFNYYSRAILRDEHAPDNHPRTIPEPPESARTDIGWEVFPEGLYSLLKRLHEDTGGKLPLVITENGAAYHTGPDEHGEVHDAARIAYYDGHLRACRRAIDEGVDLRGYFAWSLMDNFEWQEGYTQRFGLVYVDYETQRRIPKQSFRWFADVIRASART